MKKKALAMLMAIIMSITCLAPPAAAAQPATTEPPVSANAAKTSTEDVTIMVRLEGDTVFQQTGDVQAAAVGYDAQLAAIAKTENRIEATLDTRIEVADRYSLLFNGFSFSGERWMIDAINEMSGVTAFEAPMFEIIDVEVAEQPQVTPGMATSAGLVQATDVWELGYTGEGMTVAILDTGILQTHEAFSVMPENIRVTKDDLKKVFAQYGDKLHCGTDADSMYYSDKLPFNWDYFDKDAIPNHTANDHGTHVAGIAAGNNGSNFKGIAPDAQIFVMQVFSSSGGAGFDTLLAAMEDCVYLGVDAINMSLGAAVSPSIYDAFYGMEEVYDLLEEYGIPVCAAVGNDMSSTYYTNLGRNPIEGGWFSWNVDYGTVGAPGSLPGSFSVASAVTVSGEATGFFTAYGREWYPAAVGSNPTLSTLKDGDYALVSAGLGSAEEIAACDAAGKLLLVQYSDLSLTDVAAAAAAANAAGILVYSNADGAFAPAAESALPLAALTKADGEALLANLTDGAGTITVDTGIAYRTLEMADTSSWGTTSELTIKPEITAPGHYINSAVGFQTDKSYASWSGTSMATPHIAGGMLLVKQRLMERFPDKTPAELNVLANALMMSTAHQTSALVRKAGAGLMDLEAAVTAEAYLSVPGQPRPKLELDESADGSFTFSFDVTNFGDSAKTYTVVPSVLTEKVTDREYSGYRENVPGATTNDAFRTFNQNTHYYLSNPTPVNVKVINGTAYDVTDLCDVTAPETVTVAPNETVTVEMTIEASDELMDFIHENFEAGIFLEGYIALKDRSENGIDLSLPFLGFVGDWDYAPMFDLGFWWQIPYGENNMAVMPTAHGTFLGCATSEQGLGLNSYADMTGHTYLADRNAISPNGDGFYDALTYLEFSTMRTPKILTVCIQDENGKILDTLYDYHLTFYKDYLVNGYGITYSYLALDYAAQELAENETVYLVMEGWLNHEGYDPAANMNGRIVIPFTKDLTAPAVRVVDGGIEIIDAQYTAYYAIYADEARTELLYETGVFADARAMAETYETDLTTFYVATADYAKNEAFYKVENGMVTALEDDAFDRSTRQIVGRQYADQNTGENAYTWISFSPDTPNQLTELTTVSSTSPMLPSIADPTISPDVNTGVVADDGTIYIHSHETLYTLDKETWQSERVADFSVPGYTLYGAASVRGLLKNPETGVIYAMINVSGAELGFGAKWFCELDLETGALKPLWDLTFAKLGVTPFYSWMFTFVDGDTVAVFDYYTNGGSIFLVDADDGTLLDTYKMGMWSPASESPYQIGGGGGSMLYDQERNAFYLFSRWGWFRWYKHGFGGYIEYDVDTGTTTLHSVGNAAGVSMHGFFFEDEMDGADYWVAMKLIEAIGEVTTESGDAIRAAREAYDALPEERKAKVTNYEDLVQAEHRYCIVMGEQYVSDAQKAAEDAQRAYENALLEAEEAQRAAEEAQAAAEEAMLAAEKAMNETAENRAAAEEAQRKAEEAQKAAEDAQAKAEEAQARAEDAQAAAEEAQTKAEEAQAAAEEAAANADASALKAAEEAAKAAQEAANAAEEAANAARSAADAAASAQDAAASAQAAAEAQANAQAAQASAEKAQAAAEEAQRKAEEAQRKAEEAANSSAEDKEAAEEAQKAAEEAKAAAEAAQTAAEDAAAAAAASAAAAAESNTAAAEAAALAAKYAQEVTEMYLEIVELKAEMTGMLADAQAAQEAAEAAALSAAKFYVLTEITALTLTTDTSSYTAHQLEDYLAAIQAAQEAIEEATSIAEVESILAELKETLAAVEASCPAKNFNDVDPDAWYHEAVDYMVLSGMMTGKSSDRFAPADTLNRAELVTVLYRLSGEPSVEGLENPFEDVPAGQWYTDAVIWAYHAEVVNGTSGTTFNPAGNTSREQIATILYRFSGAEAPAASALDAYADAGKISAWALDAMSWAVDTGLINGMGAATLAPQGTANRAQIATILMRFCEMDLA